MSYTNHFELSDNFCSIKVDIDLSSFNGNREQKDAFVTHVAAMTKAAIAQEYERYRKDWQDKKPDNQAIQAIQERREAFDTHCEEVKQKYRNNAQKKKDSMVKPEIKEQEPREFNFRDRLPNNVVNVEDLTIEKAVTENSLVRCPSCGQAHCLAANSGSRIYFMARNYIDNEYKIVSEYDSLNDDLFLYACKREEDSFVDYYNNIRDLGSEEDVDLVVDNDSEIFCPVCHESNSFEKWKIAYDKPLSFFETENLCDACGGEKIQTLSEEQGVEMEVCENCGLKAPKHQVIKRIK